MEVIVDGSSDFKLEGEAEDMLEVIGAIGEWLQQQRRSIQSVKVDGEFLGPEIIEDKLKDRSPTTVARVEIESASIAHLIQDSLNDLAQYVPDLADACRELARVFQGDHPEEGFEPFEQLAEIWLAIKEQQMLVASALELDLDGVDIEGESFRTLHLKLNAHLEEAVDALQKEDTVLLGDLLEYELAPRAELERAIIARLQEQVPAQQAG